MVTSARPLALVALLAACGFDLPEESLLDGPRVLAVRVVPTDDESTPPAAALEPGQAATVEALIVDDAGPLPTADMSAIWLACPLAVGSPAFTCLEATLPLRREDVPACSTEPGAELPSPCLFSDDVLPAFDVPAFAQAQAGARLELTLVLAIDDPEGAQRCTDALLRGDYDTPDDCLYTSYPLTIARPDETPNRHPSNGEVHARIGTSDPVLVESGTSFTAPRGQNVTFIYTPRDGDAEAYVVPINNGSSTQTLEESPSARWFRNGAEFIANTPFDLSGEVELDPAGDTVRVYALLRDGRGGIGWWWADVVPEG